MANFPAIASFLQGLNYNTFPNIISSFGLARYFDGSELTVFVPSDGAFLSANSNARSYTFNTSDANLMSSIFQYHISPGHWNLSGIGVNDLHTLLPTSLSADLGTNDPQALCVHRTLPPGTGSAVVEILNQKVSPQFLGTASYANVTFYFIDTVLGVPSYYDWESQNTNEMTQWRALSVATATLDLNDYDGVTVLAPYDQAWNLARTLNNSQPHDVALIFNNHVIPYRTVYSSSFTTGTYASGSGFNYTFSLSPEGHYIVTLNGTSANVTTLDIVMYNGVIHLIDKPLWPIQNDAGVSGATTGSLPTSLSSTSSPTSVPDHVNKTSLPTGAVAGIAVAAAIAFLSALVISLGLWRRRQAHVELLNRPRASIDDADQPDLPPHALRTSPFTSQVDLSEGIRSVTTASTARSPLFSVQEKTAIARSGVSSANLDSFYSSNRATSPSAVSTQVTEVSHLPMSEEVMERLLQTLAQRIDRGTVAQDNADDSAPPEYPASG